MVGFFVIIFYSSFFSSAINNTLHSGSSSTHLISHHPMPTPRWAYTYAHAQRRRKQVANVLKNSTPINSETKKMNGVRIMMSRRRDCMKYARVLWYIIIIIIIIRNTTEKTWAPFVTLYDRSTYTRSTWYCPRSLFFFLCFKLSPNQRRLKGLGGVE